VLIKTIHFVKSENYGLVMQFVGLVTVESWKVVKTATMLHLEIVGMSPRAGGPVRIGYTDRSSSVTPTQSHTPILSLSR